MLQYYLAGRQPSKQALLAILILLEQAETEKREAETQEIQQQAALNAQGYCLSKSLANDMIVFWFLFAQRPSLEPTVILQNINITLHDFKLPILMTKQLNRKF